MSQPEQEDTQALVPHSTSETQTRQVALVEASEEESVQIRHYGRFKLPILFGVLALAAVGAALFSWWPRRQLSDANVSGVGVKQGMEVVSNHFAPWHAEHEIKCLDEDKLNNFNSIMDMGIGGWQFHWMDDYTFKPKQAIFKNGVPANSYWGLRYPYPGGGEISLTLRGHGVVQLNFGNSWVKPESRVTVRLNNEVQAVAMPQELSKIVSMNFKDGDELRITEGPLGVIVINRIQFSCRDTKTPLWDLALQDEAATGHRFCQPSARIPQAGLAPRAFTIPPAWLEACYNDMSRPNTAPDFGHRNWCWAWMKYDGCYDLDRVHGHWSWFRAQMYAAQKGHAPDPREFPFQPLLNSGTCELPALGATTHPSSAELLNATEWVKKNFAMFVLNLPKDVERWNRISKLLTEMNFDFERVPGIDLTVPGAFRSARERGLVPMDFDYDEASRVAQTHMGGILGTVGTAAAHFGAMQHASHNRGDKPHVMILEDDVELAPDFAVKVRKLMTEELPCDWVAVALKSRCPYGECISPHLTRVRPDGNEPEWRCFHGSNYGFYTMIYRGSTLDQMRTLLRQRVWQEKHPRCLDIDVGLAALSEEVPFYAVPAVQQPGFLREGHEGSARWSNNFATLPPQNVAHSSTQKPEDQSQYLSAK